MAEALEIVRRVDLATGTVSNVRRTPQGGMIAKASLTRTGVFNYKMPDGSTRRELRHPDDVFAPESLATYKDAPVTIDHPGRVHPGNWKEHARGHIGSVPTVTDGHVVSDVVLQDGKAIEDAEAAKLKEVSCGYECGIDYTPGTYDGQPYDVRQKNIRINHVALGPSGWGRMGPTAKLHLDSGEAVSVADEDEDDDGDLEHEDYLGEWVKRNTSPKMPMAERKALGREAAKGAKADFKLLSDHANKLSSNIEKAQKAGAPRDNAAHAAAASAHQSAYQAGRRLLTDHPVSNRFFDKTESHVQQARGHGEAAKGGADWPPVHTPEAPKPEAAAPKPPPDTSLAFPFAAHDVAADASAHAQRTTEAARMSEIDPHASEAGERSAHKIAGEAHLHAAAAHQAAAAASVGRPEGEKGMVQHVKEAIAHKEQAAEHAKAAGGDWDEAKHPRDENGKFDSKFAQDDTHAHYAGEFEGHAHPAKVSAAADKASDIAKSSGKPADHAVAAVMHDVASTRGLEGERERHAEASASHQASVGPHAELFKNSAWVAGRAKDLLHAEHKRKPPQSEYEITKANFLDKADAAKGGKYTVEGGRHANGAPSTPSNNEGRGYSAADLSSIANKASGDASATSTPESHARAANAHIAAMKAHASDGDEEKKQLHKAKAVAHVEKNVALAPNTASQPMGVDQVRAGWDRDLNQRKDAADAGQTVAFARIKEGMTKGNYDEAPTQAEREMMAESSFGDPENKKYPLDTPEHVRAASSYVEKEHNSGRLSDAKYKEIRARINAAEKRHGIGAAATGDSASAPYSGSMNEEERKAYEKAQADLAQSRADAAAAKAASDKELEKLKADAQRAADERDLLKGQLDRATQDSTTAVKADAEAAEMNRRVEETIAVRTVALKVIGAAFKADGKSVHDIKLEVLKAKEPTFAGAKSIEDGLKSTDAKVLAETKTRLDSLYDFVVAPSRADSARADIRTISATIATQDKTSGSGPEGEDDDEYDVAKARKKMEDRKTDGWKKVPKRIDRMHAKAASDRRSA